MTVTHLNPPRPPDEPPPDDEAYLRSIPTPPQDLAAEQSVLGAVLLRADALDEIRDAGLTGEDFYAPRHEAVWRAMVALADRREPPDAVTVVSELSRRGDLATIGGPAYIHTLLSGVPTAANAGYYARIVAEKAVLRRLVAAGTRIMQLGQAKDGGDLDGIVDAAQAEVAAVADKRNGAGAPEDIDATIDETLTLLAEGGAPRIPTGLADLDEKLNGGLNCQAVTTVGARPSVGKTTLGLHIALNVVDAGGVVGVTTLERDPADLMLMAYANRGGVDYGRLQKSPDQPLTEGEWRRVSRVAESLRQSGLFVSRRTAATAAMVRSDIRRTIRRRGRCNLWVVDYLQIMAPEQRGKDVLREQQVAAMMRALKLTALELRVPILLLAQLNRGTEKENREPRLSDFRESGSIEADSDVCILLHRELDPEKGDVTKLGAFVAKNRRGPTGGVLLTFEGQYQRVSAKTWHPSDALRAG
jgi:replicative DNA helicase